MSLKQAFTIICILLLAGSMSAQVPNIINYQGRLTDASGSPVADGAYLVKFIIYDASTGGTDLWNTGFQTINTVDGLFSYQLGNNISFPNGIFSDTSRYLGLTVGTDAELSPRTRFITTSYAFQAKTAATANSVAWANISSMPAGFADGVDNGGTAYTAGSGLQLVGTVFSIPNEGITNALLAEESVSGFTIVDGSIGINDLATGSVGADEIATGAVRSAEVNDNSLTANDLAPNSVGSSEIATNAVGNAEIIDGSVYAAEIATGAVGSDEIAANAVGTSEIAPSAVGSAEIAANSITVYDIQTGGVASGEILNNSIRNWDILDEPGLTQGVNTFSTDITSTTMQDVVTTTITIPTSGYIFLVGRCYAKLNGTTGINFLYIQIDETSGGSASSPNYVTVGAASNFATDSRYSSATVTNIFYKSTGTYTFRLEAGESGWNSASAASFVYAPVLTAIFIPTSYGTVNTVVQDPNSDPDTKMISITDEDGNTHTRYEVDLRNLEIRAQEAEIKALEAKQALEDAQNANR